MHSFKLLREAQECHLLPVVICWRPVLHCRLLLSFREQSSARTLCSLVMHRPLRRRQPLRLLRASNCCSTLDGNSSWATAPIPRRDLGFGMGQGDFAKEG